MTAGLILHGHVCTTRRPGLLLRVKNTTEFMCSTWHPRIQERGQGFMNRDWPGELQTSAGLRGLWATGKHVPVTSRGRCGGWPVVSTLRLSEDHSLKGAWAWGLSHPALTARDSAAVSPPAWQSPLSRDVCVVRASSSCCSRGPRK